MDLTQLPNDEYRNGLQAYLLEGERRIEADGRYAKQLRRFKWAHAVLSDVEDDLFDAGHLAARSGNEGKDDTPTVP